MGEEDINQPEDYEEQESIEEPVQEAEEVSPQEEIPAKKSRAWVWITLLIVVAILIGGGYYFWNNNELEINEIIPFVEESEFPDTIEGYSLNSRESVLNSCTSYEPGMVDVEGNVMAAGGEVCTEGVFLNYLDESTNHVIFVALTKFTQGKEIFQQEITFSSPILSLPGTDIYQIEDFEFLWFSDSEDYDEILIQEAEQTINPDDSIEYSYDYPADISNPVTQYFLDNYPPVEW